MSQSHPSYSKNKGKRRFPKRNFRRKKQRVPDQLKYILFWKPYRVLCQFTPALQDQDKAVQRETLKNFIPIPDIYPVGRLDYDSEGLLLLTNDGVVQHKLSSPQYQHPRSYWVQVEGIPTLYAIQQLQNGVIIKGNYQTKPAQVKLIDPPTVPDRVPSIRERKNIPTQWLQIQLTEGKNRQVRRMTATVNHPTLRLIRHRISCTSLVQKETNAYEFTLDQLQPGAWRALTPFEVEVLQKLKYSS